MKAIKVVDREPVLVDLPKPRGEGVPVRVVSSSICGSDLHLMSLGAFGDHVIGHEFAGRTEDGRAVAIEPILGCHACRPCTDGHRLHCHSGISMMGVRSDGGMAESIRVPAENLVELPSGLSLRDASLVEPLAVAVHGLDRARVVRTDRVLVVGAGPIGLATAAVLRAREIPYTIVARYEHQRAAAARLGARFEVEGDYDVVVDAVGTSGSLRDAVDHVRPMGRIAMLGSFWENVDATPGLCSKEIELIASTGYKCAAPARSFESASRILHSFPDIPEALVTHRFPLEGVAEAFSTAGDRAAGAIKVVFDVAL